MPMNDGNIPSTSVIFMSGFLALNSKREMV